MMSQEIDCFTCRVAKNGLVDTSSVYFPVGLAKRRISLHGTVFASSLTFGKVPALFTLCSVYLSCLARSGEVPE